MLCGHIFIFHLAIANMRFGSFDTQVLGNSDCLLGYFRYIMFPIEKCKKEITATDCNWLIKIIWSFENSLFQVMWLYLLDWTGAHQCYIIDFLHCFRTNCGIMFSGEITFIKQWTKIKEISHFPSKYTFGNMIQQATWI